MDNSHPSATDTVGAGDSTPRRGYPDKPRLTLPANNTAFAAGSRIELGGPCTLAGTRTFTANGTQADRVVFCGSGTLTSGGASLICSGAWFIWDGWTFENTKLRNATATTASNVLIRNCTARDWTGTDTAAMFHFDSSISAPDVSEHVVYYNLSCHEIGDYSGDVGSDCLMVSCGNGAKNWWILDCEAYHIGGDAVRTGTNVGGGSASNRGTNIYIGRCHFHDNSENGVDFKNGINVVLSQCTLHGFAPSPSSSGTAVAMHEDAQQSLVCGCDIYDCVSGVSATSGAQDDVWVVGCNFWNIAHDAVADPTYDPTVIDWPGAAINYRILSGASAIINCTFDDCDRFINVEATTSDVLHIVNNVFGTLKGNGSMIGFEQTAPAATAVVQHNLFPAVGGTQARVQVTTTRYTTLAAYVSAYPGKGASCVEGDPLFTNAAGRDFTIGASSAAKDVGVADYVTYGDLATEFGVSYAFDRDGVARPQGAGWDMGAHER